MKRAGIVFLCICAFSALVPSRGLADPINLINRGNGLIYDSVLNITWLQDANYAKTSGYSADGFMNWFDANTWVTNLTYGGYSDWRLPTTGPIGPDFDYSFSTDGSTDYGSGITSPNSELAYMFAVNLGNSGFGNSLGNPVGLLNTGPFINLFCGSPRDFCPTFWSDTKYGQNPLFPTNDDARWVFDMSLGIQSGDYENKLYYAWAVREGDVARPVPEPSTLLLLGTGLAGLIAKRARRRQV